MAKIGNHFLEILQDTSLAKQCVDKSNMPVNKTFSYKEKRLSTIAYQNTSKKLLLILILCINKCPHIFIFLFYKTQKSTVQKSHTRFFVKIHKTPYFSIISVDNKNTVYYKSKYRYLKRS